LDPKLTLCELGASILGPYSVTVQLGTVALATHNADLYDQDNFPEVYLTGEVVTKGTFIPGDKAIVALLAFRMKQIYVKVTRPLVGISLVEGDVAMTEFSFLPQLEDPVRLLRSEKDWHTPNGPERLRKTITELVERDVRAVLAESIQIWSAPHIEEVSGIIFSRLNSKLKAWGLRLCQEAFPHRKYPKNLSEIALQFKAAERELVEAEGSWRNLLLRKLGLEAVNLREIQNIAEGRGAGAGLFTLAKNRKKQIKPFIDWLNEQGASAAARFLEEVTSGKYMAQEVELSEQVLLASFRHPVLGLGEWGDTEQMLADTSQSGLIKDYIRAVQQSTA
jgi:hypothetical protein